MLATTCHCTIVGMATFRLYHATDVKELHEWMDQACEEHPLFVRVPALKRHSI